MSERRVNGLAHEIWAAAQLMPGEGILDGVKRIAEILDREINFPGSEEDEDIDE